MRQEELEDVPGLSGGLRGSSTAAAAAAASAGATGGGRDPAGTGNRLRRVLKRLIELLIMLASTLAALFFYKTAKDASEDNERLRAELSARRRRDRDDLGGEDACSVCLTNTREVIVQPCGHVCVCKDCADGLMSFPVPDRKCPICRAKVTKMQNAYFS